VEYRSVANDVMTDPPGNARVLFISLLAFSLGFAVWGMFSALAPFLIKWYKFSPTQVLVLAAMEPLFATAISIPLGIWTDKFGGRKVFTLLLLTLTIPLFCGLFARGYYSFLLLGLLLGLGGASFVVGNAHVSSWYPQSTQGTALGVFALGNLGITIGLITVSFVITHVSSPDGWRLVFPIFGISTLLMALVYWFFTSDSPYKQHKGESVREIVAVYRSGVVVWLIPYLYWVSFGTLVFFASAMPTYLVDQWHVNATSSSMLFTPLLVVCVAITRPLGGWLADRFDALKVLSPLFGIMAFLTLVITLQISLKVELFAIYVHALLAGAAAAAVIKLIPVYFRHVGAVSGLAKAAGAACGFTMTVTMAASKHLLGGYTFGYIVWALINLAAFYIVFSRVGFKHAKPVTSAIPVSAG
jgi:NNP family nitrate/nitrite transporter-like MFS transporter